MDLEKLNKLLEENNVRYCNRIDKDSLLAIVTFLEETTSFKYANSTSLLKISNKVTASDRIYVFYSSNDVKHKVYDEGLVKRKCGVKVLPSAIYQLGYTFVKTKEYDALPQWRAPKQKPSAKAKDKGIYGIYLEDELVYIGKTSVSFEERWAQHRQAAKKYVKGGWQQDFLYDAMRKSDKVEFKKLVIANEFSNHEIECMEYALITCSQPQFNYQGVKAPYEFTEKKENK